MEWWAFLLIAWIAVRFLGGGRCTTGRSHREHHALGSRSSSQKRDATLVSGRVQMTRPATTARKPVPAETTEERLRRQYVEGTLTVEQYERELDTLYRGRA